MMTMNTVDVFSPVRKVSVAQDELPPEIHGVAHLGVNVLARNYPLTGDLWVSAPVHQPLSIWGGTDLLFLRVLTAQQSHLWMLKNMEMLTWIWTSSCTTRRVAVLKGWRTYARVVMEGTQLAIPRTTTTTTTITIVICFLALKPTLRLWWAA